MKTYVVGGAVRDRLLGLPVADRDHVVVGATVDAMLAAGFKPVGRDFPVFLHPVTHEEYALARTERKVAPGYAGFVFHADPTVTLEADLARRDLTINAIAEEETGDGLVDPFDGRGDLARRLFRHVGPAFVEDPVRVLRVARFAARFDRFEVAPETLSLMREMATAGEIDALVPERVWREIARGLMEHKPSRMIDLLCATGAWSRLLPELDAVFGEDCATATALDRAAIVGASLEVRFAILTHTLVAVNDADARLATLCGRLAVPRGARDLAVLVVRGRAALLAAAVAPRTTANDFVGAMEAADAFRRRARFGEVLEAVALTIGVEDGRSTFLDRSAAATLAAHTVDASAIARSVDYAPSRIATTLHEARVAAVMRA